VLDAASAKAAVGADKLWPGWLDSSTLMAVVLSTKAPSPQVRPWQQGMGEAVPLSVLAAGCLLQASQASELL